MTPREQELANALQGMLGWANGGRCSDCTMFREGPSNGDFIHALDCGYLMAINKAHAALGRPREEGHQIDDPQAEMKRLAAERLHRELNR
jgi:hypothetical protein